MENFTIRTEARKASIPLWKVAHTMGISEATMTRKLRTPLSAEEEENIIRIIHCLKEETVNA